MMTGGPSALRLSSAPRQGREPWWSRPGRLCISGDGPCRRQIRRLREMGREKTGGAELVDNEFVGHSRPAWSTCTSRHELVPVSDPVLEPVPSTPSAGGRLTIAAPPASPSVMTSTWVTPAVRYTYKRRREAAGGYPAACRSPRTADEGGREMPVLMSASPTTSHQANAARGAATNSTPVSETLERRLCIPLQTP